MTLYVNCFRNAEEIQMGDTDKPVYYIEAVQ